MDKGEAMKKSRIVTLGVTMVAGLITLTGCGSSDADVAAKNLSKSAEMFEIQRRVVFFNGITDKYLLEITGLCSVETTDAALGGSLEVTCKTGPNAYKKHFLGLSDNVSYLVEQVEGADVSEYRYRVVFKPDIIIPDIDFRTEIGK
jgi:hypothetical protein